MSGSLHSFFHTISMDTTSPELFHTCRISAWKTPTSVEVPVAFLITHLAEWRPQIVCRRLMYRPAYTKDGSVIEGTGIGGNVIIVSKEP
jgi:hypothetical protein